MAGKLLKTILSAFLLLLIVCINTNNLTAQDDYEPETLNGSDLRFKQEFNTYIWNYNLNNTWFLSNGLRLSMQEKFKSSLLKLSSKNDKWKDDQNLGIHITYPLLSRVNLHTQLSSLVFLDKQSGFNNDIRTHSGKVGLEYLPFENVRIFSQIGPKWDTRYNQYNRGASYSVNVTATRFRLDEYDNNLEFLLEREKLAQRRNHDIGLAYTVFREFTPGTSDSLGLYSKNQRRDNYTSMNGDIESLQENVTGLDNTLQYAIASDMKMILRNAYSFKDVEILSSLNNVEAKRRKRNDQRFEHNLLFLIYKQKLVSRTQLSYWSQAQQYDLDTGNSGLPFSNRTAFITPDNKSNRLLLNSGLGLSVTSKDSLSSYFSITRFQYDTPDTNNFDDRDELRINTRIAALHRFNPGLSLELQANVNLYHIVYIFGERSADNNWNRIFMLRPVIHYTPGDRFYLKQSFEVLANYVDYDFEDPSLLTKSFVFRKFSLDDSLHIHITKNSSLFCDYRLQMEENGQLSWDDWTEQILVNRTKQWLHVLWRYSPSKALRIAPGYSYYVREEWKHSSNAAGLDIKIKDGVYTSQGPILRLLYTPSKQTRIIFDAVRYKVAPPAQEAYYINNIQILVKWLF